MRYAEPAAASFDEIGKALGITAMGARKIYLRAMGKLRRILLARNARRNALARKPVF
jgi:DNA-directed RNA polymerase sigma subunit (sigma70/sigma32)